MQINDHWLKMNLNIAKTAQEISLYLTDICNQNIKDYHQFLDFASLLNNHNFVSNLSEAFQLEKILYPAKIIDVDIPTFIIPIKY